MPRPTKITLYQFETCPYCETVRATLRELDLGFQTVEVPRHDRSIIHALGSETVPVIRDGDVVMNESSDICRYLIDTYGRAAA